MPVRYEYQNTGFKCATCGQEIVLRTEIRTTLQDQAGMKSRQHVCSYDDTHDIGPMTVRMAD